MVIALTLLCLYAADILPWSKITCCFLSSLFIYVLTSEGFYGFSLLCFAATAGLAFLLLPDRAPLYLYLALLGHYGIFKTFADTSIQDKILRFILKLVYCNAFVLGAALLAFFLFSDAAVFAALPAWSQYLLVGALQLVFIAFDVLYTLCCKFYDNILRSRLLPRR